MKRAGLPDHIARSILCIMMVSLCLSLSSCVSVSKSKEVSPYKSEAKRFSCTANDVATTITYYEIGEGESVMLIHGFAASSYTWHYVADTLARNYKVIIPDLRGFGLSDKPLDSYYSADDQADLLCRLIIEKDLKNITVVGHSFGGAVALSIYSNLLKEKHRIKKMILLDSFMEDSVLPLKLRIAGIPLFAAIVSNTFSSGLKARMILKSSYFDTTKITEETFDAYAYYLSLPGSSHAMTETARYLFYGDTDKLQSIARSLDIPVLVLWGSDDPVIPTANSRRLSSLLRKPTLSIIAQCGHIPQEEKPSETLKIVTEFLALEDCRANKD